MKMIYGPFSLRSRAVSELEVWDQIRRTEEDRMEIGTMDDALLPGDSAEAGYIPISMDRLSRSGAGSTSATDPCLP